MKKPLLLFFSLAEHAILRSVVRTYEIIEITTYKCFVYNKILQLIEITSRYELFLEDDICLSVVDLESEDILKYDIDNPKDMDRIMENHEHSCIFGVIFYYLSWRKLLENLSFKEFESEIFNFSSLTHKEKIRWLKEFESYKFIS